MMDNWSFLLSIVIAKYLSFLMYSTQYFFPDANIYYINNSIINFFIYSYKLMFTNKFNTKGNKYCKLKQKLIK